MSTITTKSGNNFFNNLCDDATYKVFEFLKPADDRSILATARVCKDWASEPVLIKERNDASERLSSRICLLKDIKDADIEKKYPEGMRKLFRKCSFPLSQLPVLDLDPRNGTLSYIYLIDPFEMSHPVMRFIDTQGRPGVAIHIKGAVTGTFRMSPKSPGIPFQSIEGVLVIFKRYSSANSQSWALGWGDSDQTIERVYKKIHVQNDHVGGPIDLCPKCPFSTTNVNDFVLENLLRNQDPLFLLPGHKTTTARAEEKKDD